ncbi:MAG: DUF4153 domain-containing protein, partial [bacterium]|nr:DUF4153 domain-containing protein [bacterium]
MLATSLRDILTRIIATIVLGIPLSLCVAMVIEKLNMENRQLLKLAMNITVVIILVLYYLFLLPGQWQTPTLLRLIFNTLALGVAFFFIPYLMHKENIEVYLAHIISKAAITVVFTYIAALGVIGTLFAVKALLYSAMSENLYAHVGVLASLIIAPLIFLSGFPEKHHTFTLQEFNKIIKLLIIYIVLPIISIYTLVLYVYFGKIILTQVWPKDIVSYLVLSYTAIGISAIFFVSPFSQENRWVNNFIKAYTKLIFPLLAMMVVAIFIRVKDFGYTENRYIIVAIGVWATLVMVYFNFNKGRQNIWVPISLAITLVLMVNGPFSAFNTSIRSQNARFFTILNKNNMISEGVATGPSATLSDNDRRDINSIIYYFHQNHGLKALKYLPAGFTISDIASISGSDTHPDT